MRSTSDHASFGYAGWAAFLSDNRQWLAAGALLTLLSSFGQTFFISIFAAEIQGAFDLSHGAWGMIYALGTMGSAAVMLWSGALTDHWRARSLGMVVLACLAGACLAMALNPFAALLPVVVFLLRFTGQGMTSHIAMVAMGRWFKATRGRALSVATLGFSIGEAILPVTFVALMTVMDWRALWILAAVLALGGIPILRALLHEERTPQAMAAETQSEGMDGRHWRRGEALGHPLFWCAVPTLAGPSAFGTAFFFHQVHYADVNGWSHLGLVALFPIYTGFSVMAMLASGVVLDRIGTARMMPYVLGPITIGFLCFGFAVDLWVVSLGLVFFAITTGAYATTSNAFWAEFYGTAHLGAIKAMGAAVMVLGSAIGPGLTGLLIDAGIGLERQYIGVAGYFVLAGLIMLVGIGNARHRLPLAA